MKELSVSTIKIKDDEITRLSTRASTDGAPAELTLPATFLRPVKLYVDHSNTFTVTRQRDGAIIGGNAGSGRTTLADIDPEMTETYAISTTGAWSMVAVVRTR